MLGFFARRDSMKIQTLPLKDLSASLQGEWREWQKASASLRGPCFHPLLFKTVGAHFDRTHVLVLEDGNQRGFLPFQLATGPRLAEPVPLCDYQMIVGSPGARWDIRKILSSARLVAWDFSHLLVDTVGDEPNFSGPTIYTRQIDLHAGYDRYVEDLRLAGKTQKNLKEKRKKLERDLGPVRFVALDADPARLESIFTWKGQRFGEFSESTRACLRALHRTHADGFRGVLSSLWAGDTLVAVHFGMVADGTLFYWFPAFNPELSRYTPGALLIQDLIANLSQFKATILDLGPGGEGYKNYSSNRSLALTSGAYELPTPFTYLRKCKRTAFRAIRGNRVAHNVAKKTTAIVRYFKKAS